MGIEVWAGGRSIDNQYPGHWCNVDVVERRLEKRGLAHFEEIITFFETPAKLTMNLSHYQINELSLWLNYKPSNLRFPVDMQMKMQMFSVVLLPAFNNDNLSSS